MIFYIAYCIPCSLDTYAVNILHSDTFFIKSLHPASERINSSAKDTDNGVLSYPMVRRDKRASILTQIAGIVILLKRIFGFIVRVSLRIRKLFAGNDKKLYKELFLTPPIPAYLEEIVQRE